MNECKGDWVSSITWTRRKGKNIPPAEQKKESDGTIKIEDHGGSTSIKGKHKKDIEQNIEDGQCSLDAQGKRILSFRRKENAETFIYRGTVSGNKIVDGKVRVPGGGPDPGDTGTWESDRTGGGGPSPGKGKGAGKGKNRSPGSV